MGRFLGDLLGTLKSTFKLGRSTLDASGLTAARSLSLPDYDVAFQSSKTDSAALRAMITGAFGHGSTPANPPPLLANLDAADTPSGQYMARAASGTTGTFPPIAGGFDVGVVDVLRLDLIGTLCVQVFRGPASGLSGGNPLTYHRAIHSVLGASTWRVVWDGQNFDPATKADLVSPEFSGVPVLSALPQLKGGAAGASNICYLGFHDSAGTRIGYVGDASSGDQDMRLLADLGNLRLTGGGVQAVISSTGMTVGGDQVQTDDGAWISLTLTNGWSANATFGTPAYRRIGNLVFLRGVIQAATSNNNKVAFTLPAGYRPATQWFFSVAGGAFLASDGVLSIATNGQATANDISAPATCNINLTGCVLVAA